MVSKYYWPKIKDDINFQINVFDRIGIDLVLGLPVTEEKFVGILVITEYFTKFPYVVPIRLKEANEITTRLFEYFSHFGPPRIMQSDQGPEFENKVVKALTTMVGAEHVGGVEV